MDKNKFHEQKICKSDSCGLCCTKINNIAVTIGKNKILENINLHIHCGELTAIIGPNGAGKSTLLKVILGELDYTGELKFLDAYGIQKKKSIIGYVPQHLTLDRASPTSVLDLFVSSCTSFPVWLYTPKKILNKVVEILSRVKAEHLINRKIGALSGGELQRVLLALALEPIPDILLLDEPVSGIDQNGLELFYQTVSELRKNYDLTIILVSHDLDLVGKYSDRIVVLQGKVVACGTPEQVYNSDDFYDVFSIKWQKNKREFWHATKEGAF